MLTRIFSATLLLAATLAGQTGSDTGSNTDAKPLRLAIAGLSHDHVSGLFRGLKGRTDVEIVGIWDPSTELQRKYGKQFGFADAVLFSDLETMLDKVKPEAVATFTSTDEHAMVVQTAAKRHIDVMMEKPLAVSLADARLIEKAARESGIHVVVNYETTWYRSHAAMYKLIRQQGAAGEIRKMVAMDGHEGPKEIGVSPVFLGWLTDPVKNGPGALFDFGCYGANLMTWMMDNQRPVAVTATLQTFKPQTYGRVDDEANVLLDYPNAAGIIQGSWNWPYGRKDFEVYGQHGYAYAIGGDELRTRVGDAHGETVEQPGQLPEEERNSISYLKAVVRGSVKVKGLSSLENNLIVMEILDAARESARTGKRITLAAYHGTR